MKIPEPRQLKSGSWNVQIQLGSERKSITRPTKKECFEEAVKIKTKYLENSMPKKAEEIKLSDAISEYIESRTNVISPSTLRSYKSILKNRLQTAMGKPLGSINWQSVVNAEARVVSAKTLKNTFGLVTSTYNYFGLPAPKATLPQVIRETRPWLSAEEIPIFVDAIKGDSCELVALLALHSLRKSEIFGLGFENIKNGAITVNGAKVEGEHGEKIYKATNKNSSSRRTIPIMIPRVVELCEGKTGPVGTMGMCVPRTHINKICRENNLPEVGVHGLRHSFASLAYHVGLSERETMAIGGWSDINTMHQIYTHISEADKLNAANKVSDFFNCERNVNEKF